VTTSSPSVKLTGYDLGKSATFALKSDQRFSYCTFTPASYRPGQDNNHQLLVLIHGSDRSNQALRDYFTDFAEQHNCILLAPLFPCAIEDSDDRDNYKYIAYKGIRFDRILMSMIDEISTKYRMFWPKFSMFGFSGGAHFAHRFLLLHPHRLTAVSVAAPGSVTRIDDSRDWWVGTKNMEQLFGVKIDLNQLRKPQVHLCVGDQDLDTSAISHKPGSPHWMEGANNAGVTRVDRLHSLYRNFRGHGMKVSLELAAGKNHDTDAMSDCAMRFLAESFK